MRTYMRGALAAFLSVLVLATAYPAHGDTTSTTIADAPVADPAAATTTAPAPTATTVPDDPAAPATPQYRPLPRLRCQPGINACIMAIRHQRAGRYLWRDGERFTHHGRIVRGHPDITWARMRW